VFNSFPTIKNSDFGRLIWMGTGSSS